MVPCFQQVLFPVGITCDFQQLWIKISLCSLFFSLTTPTSEMHSFCKVSISLTLTGNAMILVTSILLACVSQTIHSKSLEFHHTASLLSINAHISDTWVKISYTVAFFFSHFLCLSYLSWLWPPPFHFFLTQQQPSFLITVYHSVLDFFQYINFSFAWFYHLELHWTTS